MDTSSKVVLEGTSLVDLTQLLACESGVNFRSWVSLTGEAFSFTLDGVRFAGYVDENSCVVFRAPGWRAISRQQVV